MSNTGSFFHCEPLKISITGHCFLPKVRTTGIDLVHCCVSYPDVNKGEAGKVESSKESKEGRIEDRHHCVTTGEGALNNNLRQRVQRGALFS